MSRTTREAIHEAAHAVIAHLCGGEVESLSIGPSGTGEALIKAFHQPGDNLVESPLEVYNVERELQVGMAGALAEAVYYDEPLEKAIDLGGDEDLLMMLQAAGDLYEDDETVRRRLLKAGQDVLARFGRPGVWGAIEAVADELGSSAKLTGFEVRQIVRRHVVPGAPAEFHRPSSPRPVLFTGFR